MNITDLLSNKFHLINPLIFNQIDQWATERNDFICAKCLVLTLPLPSSAVIISGVGKWKLEIKTSSSSQAFNLHFHICIKCVFV